MSWACSSRGDFVFRLILHHPYTRLAEAIDVSGAGSHGLARDVSFAPDGSSLGSGAFRYALPSSRVRVAPRPVFQHLHALKIEMTVRVGALGDRRNLVEGHLSFAFFIHPDGVLRGTALGRQASGGPLVWQGADSASGSPDGATRVVPVGQWVKLTYLHDGFASIRLLMDDELVAAYYGLASPIRPLGSYGLHIGNWPDADAYAFDGEVDDVKIWAWDPDAAYHQFFSRTSGRVWREVFRAIGGLGVDEIGGRRLATLLSCIGSAQNELIRTVRSAGEEAIAENERFSRRYRELWASGEVDGDQMRELLIEWLRWLQALVGRERWTGYVEQLRRCFIASGLNVESADLSAWEESDPQFVQYIRALMELELT
jgi:hypothetical protein